MDTILEIKGEEFEREVLKAERPVLVDFWAAWCMPCRMQGEVLHEVLPSLDGKAKIVKINVDESEDLAIKFGVSAIPTLMVFNGGELKEKNVGLASKDDVAEMLAKYIG